jgi:hypothetical protein
MKFEKKKWKDMSTKEKSLGMGGLLFIGIILFNFLIGSKPNKEPGAGVSKTSSVVTPSPTNKPSLLERLGYEDKGVVENYHYLYLGEDKLEESLTKVAIDIKKNNCKKQCNISLFDNKKAYETDRNKVGKLASKDYVFVADHLIGYLEFSTDAFLYYPYKDWYYDELKSK